MIEGEVKGKGHKKALLEEYTKVFRQWVKDGVEYFASHANNDSMFPTVSKGDILVFEKTDTLSADDIGAFSYGGRYYCKRMKKLGDGNIWLLPDNTHHDPIKVEEPGELLVLGRLKTRTTVM